MKFIALLAIFTLVITETITKDVVIKKETDNVTANHSVIVDDGKKDAVAKPVIDATPVDIVGHQPTNPPTKPTPPANTTTETPSTTTTTTTPPANTTTPAPITTPPPSTTTVHPNPNTTSTTVKPSSTTVDPSSTTPTPSNTTTLAPATTTADPSHKTDRKFDMFSFVAGIVMSAGLLAIGLVAFKFYEARRDRNYHTI